jgi:hypothetical protein
MITFKNILKEGITTTETIRIWNELGWTKNSRFKNKYVEKLKQILLSIKGVAVILPEGNIIDNPASMYDIMQLLKRGSLIKHKKAISLKKGNHNSCHANSARIWEQNKNKFILQTGFAFSEDAWREHTWIYNPEDMKIIETTVKRELYYGFSMNKNESEKFAFNNIY